MNVRASTNGIPRNGIAGINAHASIIGIPSGKY